MTNSSGQHKVRRVLIAEDMQTSYHILKTIIEQSPDFEIIGQARDGLEVVGKALELKPDIITMDIHMPKQSGLVAIEQIMTRNPIPIVVISEHTRNREENLVFEALERGAIDVLAKPGSVMDDDFAVYARTLRQKLLAFSEIKLVKRRPRFLEKQEKTTELEIASAPEQSDKPVELVVLGASAGGPEALLSILSVMSDAFPLPIVIGQHILNGFVDGMVNWLNQQCRLTVKVAMDHERLRPGVVYFSQDDRHLLVDRVNGELQAVYSDAPPVKGFRPSIDRLLASAAKTCAGHLLGGILTGMGSDGADGLRQIYELGGETFVQDEATSLIYGMPAVAHDMGAAKQQLALDQIPAYLCSFGRLLGEKV